MIEMKTEGEIKARINILVHLFQDIESEKKIMKKTKEGWVGFDKMTYLLKLVIKIDMLQQNRPFTVRHLEPLRLVTIVLTR
jgi:hypothetical protein